MRARPATIQRSSSMRGVLKWHVAGLDLAARPSDRRPTPGDPHSRTSGSEGPPFGSSYGRRQPGKARVRVTTALYPPVRCPRRLVAGRPPAAAQ
jgi:hypothetical protein